MGQHILTLVLTKAWTRLHYVSCTENPVKVLYWLEEPRLGLGLLYEDDTALFSTTPEDSGVLLAVSYGGVLLAVSHGGVLLEVSHGGVLLVVSREFTDKQITTDTDKEIIATKISTGCKTSLVIVSVYRPPNTDIDYALDVCSKIKHIVNTNRSATIWISGDLNLPDIDWKTESIEGHQHSNAINTAFLSAFQELGLAQIVDFPTRLHNTLDLFLTNRPSMISNCTPLPGVSDHEIILTISDVQAKRLKPVRKSSYGTKPTSRTSEMTCVHFHQIT